MPRDATTPQTSHKGEQKGASPPSGGLKGRISPALRKAISLKIEKGLTIAEACKLAGVSEAGFYKAMLRPNVQAFADAMENRLIAKVGRMREINRARAFEVAQDLLLEAKTPAEKWKAVEFWTREAANAPAVQVNIGGPSGYEYVRPGSRIVDVTPADTDQPSDDKPA